MLRVLLLLGGLAPALSADIRDPPDGKEMGRSRPCCPLYLCAPPVGTHLVPLGPAGLNGWGGAQRFRCPPGPHGQQHWPEAHPECGGRAQSPIDIATSRAQHDPSLPPLLPEGYERPESPQLSLANNGHTAVLALPPSLRLRGLPRTFAAVQLHFHWGRPGSAAGAEHLLDGRRAPAEMHVVHFDSERFADASAAQQQPGGLAVLGVLLELGDNPHPAYDNILRHLGSIRHAGQTVDIPSFSIRELLPERLERYYRYNGSLTTPPCSQSVLWNVLPQPVRISRAQLEQLQGSLYCTKEEEEPQLLVNNFRAPQELNARSVLSSFRGSQGYSTGAIIAIIFGTIACCAGLFLAFHFGAKRMRARREQAQDVAFKSSPRSSPTPAEP
ncbi:carbonic anhydrase 14 [Melospiza georgiana]|uniref:carbonic anhydrase 14 n=1 Tax=Melospiza georgiana TaxID=44398 RepID=UPI0025AD124A|nr:carbonic anhydrase 14 [Melospiza georgiana]